MSKKRQSFDRPENTSKHARVESPVASNEENLVTNDSHNKIISVLLRNCAIAKARRLKYIRRQVKADAIVEYLSATLEQYCDHRLSSYSTKPIETLSNHIRLKPVFADAHEESSPSVSPPLQHALRLMNIEYKVFARPQNSTVDINLLFSIDNISEYELADISLYCWPTPATAASLDSQFASPHSLALKAHENVAVLCLLSMSMNSFLSAASLVVRAQYTSNNSKEDCSISTLEIQQKITPGAPQADCISLCPSLPLQSTPPSPSRCCGACSAVTAVIATKCQTASNLAIPSSFTGSVFEQWKSSNNVVTVASHADLLWIGDRACVLVHNSPDTIAFTLVAISDTYLRLLLRTLQNSLPEDVSLTVSYRSRCFDSADEPLFTFGAAAACTRMLEELSFWAILMRQQQQRKRLKSFKTLASRQPHYKLGALESISETNLKRLYEKEEATDIAMLDMLSAFDDISFAL